MAHLPSILAMMTHLDSGPSLGDNSSILSPAKGHQVFAIFLIVTNCLPPLRIIFHALLLLRITFRHWDYKLS
jgi:hypothetical protein